MAALIQEQWQIAKPAVEGSPGLAARRVGGALFSHSG